MVKTAKKTDIPFGRCASGKFTTRKGKTIILGFFNYDSYYLCLQAMSYSHNHSDSDTIGKKRPTSIAKEACPTCS